MATLDKLTAKVGAALIRLYQCCISGLKPPCCRFQPSCSEYARQALLSFGAMRGSWLALKRLVRCHPLYRGPAHDPVPDRASRGLHRARTQSGS